MSEDVIVNYQRAIDEVHDFEANLDDLAKRLGSAAERVKLWRTRGGIHPGLQESFNPWPSADEVMAAAQVLEEAKARRAAAWEQIPLEWRRSIAGPPAT
jgi:hypothetical protein